MFWRKTKAAIASFHPLHQALISHHTVNVALDRAGWMELVASLSRHNGLVRRRKWALPPRTLDVLVPLVQILTEDMPPGAPLAVAADLRGRKPAEKKGPRQKIPVRPPVRSATEWWITDPWLWVHAPLRDGSELRLTVVDRIRHRRMTKRSRSGKYKIKTKTKETQLVRVSRTLPRGFAGQRPGTAPPPWITVRIRDRKRRSLTASAKLPTVPRSSEQVQHILTVVTETFRWTPPGTVRPARRTA
jgi:hypothetical protein